MTYVARVNVPSRDHPRGVDAIRESKGGGFRGARRIEGRESTVVGSDEPMKAAARAVKSCDRPRGVNGAGLGLIRTRDIERRQGSVPAPQEAVNRITCVLPRPGNGPLEIDRVGRGIDGACGIERGRGAVGSAQEAVSHEVYVVIESDNIPRVIDASGSCPIDAARSVKRGEGAARTPQKTMFQEVGVVVRPRDDPRQVDSAGVEVRECRPGRIERDDGTSGRPQKAVTCDCVTIKSGDRTLQVDADWIGANGKVAGARGVRAVKRGDGAQGTAHEAVK